MWLFRVRSKVTGYVYVDAGSPETSQEDTEPAPTVATYFNPTYRPALEEQLSSTDVKHAALSFRCAWRTLYLTCWCVPPMSFRGKCSAPDFSIGLSSHLCDSIMQLPARGGAGFASPGNFIMLRHPSSPEMCVG